MSTDEIRVKFECLKCGGSVLQLPDDYTDASIAKCKLCETEFGTWRDIKAKAISVVRNDVSEKLRDTFRGLKGWKVQ